MKKLLLSCALACATLAAGAQGIYQFADPGFEGNWRSSEEPGNGWNSFPSAGGSMASLGKGSSPKPSKVEGHNSSVAVKLYSKNIFGVKANGNLTTGKINMGNITPANSANYNYTDRSSSNNSLRFAGRPDAVSFYAKFTPGAGNQARGQFILHDDCDYRDPEISDQSGNRVGKASILIDASTDWKYYEGAFTYDMNSTPEVQYLLGSFTTNPTPGGSQGDELIIDDIHFIYYSTLGGVLYDPAAIDFKEEVLNYTVDAEYSAIDFYCTTKGKGATKELSYDENTGVLTVTVKGNDISVNPDNYTVYTFTFKTGGETPDPDPDPDPDPNPDPEPEVKPLGTPVATLAELSNTETYAVYNDTYTAYLIYSEANSTSKVWTAEMSGSGDHWLSNSAYAGAFDVTAAAQSWMAIQYEGSFYLYNVGAQKFLTTPGYSGETGACTFSSNPVALQTTDLGNGWFAFSATGNEKDWICAAPQLPNPVSIWTTSDSGARWQFRPNPNVEYDAQVIAKYFTPSGISAVSNDTVANAMIYDLSGRPVGTLRKALPRGIYIQNNKKFFVK